MGGARHPGRAQGPGWIASPIGPPGDPVWQQGGLGLPAAPFGRLSGSQFSVARNLAWRGEAFVPDAESHA
eukprot:14913808-Alexandrium_andersonii.AAC.1